MILCCCSITVSTKAATFITSVIVDLKGEGKEISMKLPAKEIQFQNKPYIPQYAVMFPLKELLEAMGTKVEVINNKQQGTMTVTIGENKIQFFDKQKTVIVNDKNIEMATAAEIKDNRLYIPVKAMFEILDVPEQNIIWIAEKEVILTY